jgi:hypothetical protein
MGFVLGKRFSGGKLICQKFPQESTIPMSLAACRSLVCAPVENYQACSYSLEPLISASANQPRLSWS